jgi:hypothetical protein
MSDKSFSVFRPGSYIGKTFREIEDAKIFGPRVFPRAKRGKWNARYRLEYEGGIGDENPYSTEVGFFDDRRSCYFLIQKRHMEKGLRMSEAEVIGHLYKVAGEGEWGSGKDSNGTLYEYKLKKKERVLLAFHTPNFRQLLIFTPKVSPNLDGMSASPMVLLR